MSRSHHIKTVQGFLPRSSHHKRSGVSPRRKSTAFVTEVLSRPADVCKTLYTAYSRSQDRFKTKMLKFERILRLMGVRQREVPKHFS